MSEKRWAFQIESTTAVVLFNKYLEELYRPILLIRYSYVGIQLPNNFHISHFTLTICFIWGKGKSALKKTSKPFTWLSTGLSWDLGSYLDKCQYKSRLKVAIATREPEGIPVETDHFLGNPGLAHSPATKLWLQTFWERMQKDPSVFTQVLPGALPCLILSEVSYLYQTSSVVSVYTTM